MSDKTVNALVEALVKEVSAPAPAPREALQHLTAIHEKLSELIEVQSGRGKAQQCGSTDFKAFKTWLAAGNCPVSKVDIAAFGEAGNGLVATSDIKANELLLNIPLSICMTVHGAEESSVHKLISTDKWLQAAPSTALAFLILNELHDKDSKWQPYLTILPSTYSTPLYWTKDELAALSTSQCFAQVVNVYRQVARQYGYLHELIRNASKAKLVSFDARSFTYEDFRWAMSVVSTRQNQIPKVDSSGSVDLQYALIPLWDMMNHQHGKITTEFDTATRTTQYKALRAFAKGEQICMHYGARSNFELVLHSGFFYDDHPSDFMTIKLGVGKGDKLHQQKSTLLTNLSIPSSGDFVISNESSLDAQTQAFIRVNAMTEDELKGLFADPSRCATLGEAICSVVSKDCETKACQFLQTRCRLLLRAYEKALETSVKPDASYPMKCALSLLKAEHAMLSATADLLKARQDNL